MSENKSSKDLFLKNKILDKKNTINFFKKENIEEKHKSLEITPKSKRNLRDIIDE